MKWIRFLLVMILVIVPFRGWAQQCMVSSVAVHFGEYDTRASSPVNASGLVNVTCSEPTIAVIKLDPGKHSSGSFIPRKLRSGDDYLAYNLYTDAACTKIWGDGTGNTFTQIGEPTLHVYGRIPPHQNVSPGVYEDFVTIIVEW